MPRLSVPSTVGGLVVALALSSATSCGRRGTYQTASVPDASAELAPLAPPATPPAPGSSAVGSTSQRSGVGYNLDFPGWWSKAMPLIDLMKNAGHLRGQCLESRCDQYGTMRLDAQGWPTRIEAPLRAVEAPIAELAAGHPYVGKAMVMTWEGDGTVEGHNMGSLSIDPGRRRATFTLQAGTTFVRIASTDPGRNGRYLRKLRVFRADWEARLERGELFNPDYLDYLRPFASVRFMDWMLANDPQPRDVEWDDRARFDGAWLLGQFRDRARPREEDRTLGGYPPELLVALANQTHSHPHFCLPYRATEAYVRSFARLIRDRLDPGLRATFERGNETWNWAFPAAQFANIEGRKRWPNNESAWTQYNAVRAAEMCRWTKEEFGAAAGRVRCVMTPQTGWTSLAPTHLDCPDHVAADPARNLPCHRGADAIAITGYFGSAFVKPEAHPILREWLKGGRESALDRVFAALETGKVPELGAKAGAASLRAQSSDPDGDGVFRTYQTFARLAKERGLELYVYEGGTHFDLPDSGPREIRELLLAATRDPRMTRLYQANFDAFFAAGGTTFNVWGWIAPQDLWANADDVLDRRHPKYAAVLARPSASPASARPAPSAAP